MANDEKKKMSEKMSDKLVKNLRYLLVDKNDLAEMLCSTGSTSLLESNHARIVDSIRGFYTKGEKLILILFDLI